MFSYRFMQMNMEGNRVASKRVSPRDIIGTGTAPGRFMVAPTSMSMQMQMHMLGVMYGLSDKVTLMGMANFASNEMDHLARNGRVFSTESSGLGDTEFTALVGLYKSGQNPTKVHSAHLNIGVSLPTGSIDQRDDTPAMANAVLPYPMQLGSGTVDLLPGITYSGTGAKWAWGGQAYAVLRLGANDEAYTLGDRSAVTAWVARDIGNNMSLSARLEHQDWGNTDGQNRALNPRVVQTADPRIQGGQRTDLSVGFNILFGDGYRFTLDYGQPIRQRLEGPQLGADSTWTAAWQKAF